MTILDPFMGSGTTAVACRQLGVHYIGFEIDPVFHAIAEKRVSEAIVASGLDRFSEVSQ